MTANNGERGRPLLYDDPEEMDAKIEEYFGSITRERMLFIRADEDPNLTPAQVAKMTDKQRMKKIPAKDCNGNHIRIREWIVPPSEGDLHRYIGIRSRDTWRLYAEKNNFSDTISRAKAIIEDYYKSELMNRNGNTAGLQFVFRCCYGYRDVQYVKTESVAKLEDEFV